MIRKLAIVSFVGMCGFVFNAGAAAQAFKHENKPENLKALFELVHQTVHVKKDNKGATALFAGLIPNEARAKAAFKDKIAPDVQSAILDMHKKLNFKEDGAPKLARATQTVVKVHGAKTEDIIAYREGSVAHKEFPGGTRRVAAEALKPGMMFYEVEYLEPGKESGMKYHLLYWDGKQWSMLGPAWRVLREDKKK